MRRLVVTADDLGLHPAIHRGVARACDEGMVTAASVVACGRAFGEAVALLRARPRIDAGAHLTLVGERPLSPPREIPTLVGPDGAFLPGWPAFLRRYATGRVRLEEIEGELRRQLARLSDAGLPLLHLNSHQHLHALPRLFALVVALAREHGVPFVRLPTRPGGAGVHAVRGTQLVALGWLARRAARRLSEALPDVAFRVGGERPSHGPGEDVPGSSSGRTVRLLPAIGIAEAGHLTAARLQRLLPTLDKASELVVHPGADDPALAATYRWGYDWGRETEVLCDPAAREALRAAEVELTDFRHLRDSMGP